MNQLLAESQRIEPFRRIVSPLWTDFASAG